MNLAQALRLLPPLFPASEGIALTGSGGKTTAMFQLARSLCGATGQPVILTASTHLHVDQIKLADSHRVGEKPEDFAGIEDHLHGVILITGPIDGDRSRGLENDLISWLHALCVRRALPLLIEADGSRQHPLKAPAEHEPAIPEFVNMVVVVAGLSGLGKPLTQEFVHRPEIFSRLGGLSSGEPITPAALIRVLTHPAGGLKNIPARARRHVLLNQADTPELLSIGGKMAQDLLRAFNGIVVGTLQPLLIQTFEPIAGIILAAGEASRFGQPKQLLDYHGQPFVRAVAKTALASALSPVVVVTGANAPDVESAVQDLPVMIIRNDAWQSGQSSSIKAGLQASSPSSLLNGRGMLEQVGAAIFLLADQPQVSPTVIRALVEQHRLELAPVLAPLIRDRRANPVLFDRVTFPDLISLTGDVGGRAILSKYPVTYLPWQDESLLLDVDTPEDYQRLIDGEQ